MTTELVRAFISAIFLFNAIPHLVNGLSGARFPSPFAKPPGVGLSSPMVNVLWAWVNILLGFFIGFYQSNAFATLNSSLVFFAGGMLLSLSLAWHFGKINSADRPQAR